MPTKEELREQVIKAIAKESCCPLDEGQPCAYKNDCDTCSSERILSLLELASYFREGYAKLADDQSLPDNIYQIPLKQFLTANGFKKVVRQ
jgi:hypothetical protein